VLSAQRDESPGTRAAAANLLSVGSFKVKENLDARKVAAWANVASLIF